MLGKFVLPSTFSCIAEVVHAFGLLARPALPLLLGRRLSGFALLAYLVEPGLVILVHTFGLLARLAFPLLLSLSLSLVGFALLAYLAEPGRVIIFLLHLPTCIALLAALAMCARAMQVSFRILCKFIWTLCFATRRTCPRTASHTNATTVDVFSRLPFPTLFTCLHLLTCPALVVEARVCIASERAGAFLHLANRTEPFALRLTLVAIPLDHICNPPLRSSWALRSASTRTKRP